MKPLRLCAALLAGAATHAAYAAAAEPVKLKPVEVVGSTPLPGSDVPRDHVPANVQTLEGAALRHSQALSLPELVSQRLQSVHVNETQGNPFQMDVSYRGFTASPLLGFPQGLSVYVDGVRVNEPFGDVVNWDLIPLGAIDSIALMPGSNPLFGLNTLGGALVLQTKRGDRNPGTEASVSAGSFGRRKLDFAHGGMVGHTHGFVALSGFEEDGWRDHSESRVRSAFGKVGSRIGAFEWDLALTYGRTNLIGNGLLPEHLLAVRREQVYTHPDLTRNEVLMGVLNASYAIASDQRVSALLYRRANRTSTLNGDVNDDFDDPPDPAGVENRTSSRQKSEGLALQWSRLGEHHQLTAGASFDRSRSRFVQTEAEGEFDATRRVMRTEAPEIDAQLRGATRTLGVYVSHVHELRHDLQLTLAARFNSARVQTVDELNPPGGPNLNGDYTYSKLNPAAGVTWQANPALTLFGGFSQGNRAPSPIELGCADPAQPCTLPNALQSDPYLKQVVARTLELGARGKAPGDYRWSAALFRTVNRDDILFVGTTASASRGFFQNFGRTRRQGLELGLGGRTGIVDWQAGYSYVRATFESTACVVAEANSTAGRAPNCAAEQIEVQSGNTIPGVPRHSFKLHAQARPVEGWTLGASTTAYSAQYARGNENNAHRPDGVQFNGSGRLPGFALVDVYTTYALGAGWEVFGRVSNLFDRAYATAGQLGRSAFDAQGRFIPDDDAWRNEQFVGPGAPRAGWIGLRYVRRK